MRFKISRFWRVFPKIKMFFSELELLQFPAIYPNKILPKPRKDLTSYLERFLGLKSNEDRYEFWSKSFLEKKYKNPSEQFISDIVNKGYHKIDNVLSTSEHKNIIAIANNLLNLRPTIFGTTSDGVSTKIFLPNIYFLRCPSLLYLNKLIGKKFELFYGKFSKPQSLFISQLKSVGRDNCDPNTDFHIDRFIPTLKAFYFPFPVDESNAPFSYIPSTGFFNKDFKKEYLESPNLIKLPQGKAFQLSKSYSFSSEPILFTNKGNTLVIADTSGLHRRTPFVGSGSRVLLGWAPYNTLTTMTILRKSIF